MVIRVNMKYPNMPRYYFLLLLLLIICACDEPAPNTFQGYVEGEFVYVASPLGGRLETLNVRRGDTVKKGDSLFVLEHALEEAIVREASQKHRQAMDRLANLKKGKRPSEIQAITARQKSAQAGLELARLEYDRRVKLSKKQFISQESLDRARTEYRQMQAAGSGNFSGSRRRRGWAPRTDEIKAAEAEADAVKRTAGAGGMESGSKNTGRAKSTGLSSTPIFIPENGCRPGGR